MTSNDALDKLLQALQGLTQTQTDTLALIIVILFLVGGIITLVLGFSVFRSFRSKIVIPSTNGGPSQIVSEKEFMGVLLNTLLDRLKALNTQNDALGERLRESLAVSEKLVPAVERLVGRVERSVAVLEKLETVLERLSELVSRP